MELSFNIDDFIKIKASGIIPNDENSYKCTLAEYFIPAIETEKIAEIKDSDINYIECNDGSIHFNLITYEDVDE